MADVTVSSDIHSFMQSADNAAALSALGITDGDVVYVNDKDDFPAASDSVITLAADTTYVVNTNVDLLGDRISCAAGNVMIKGRSFF